VPVCHPFFPQVLSAPTFVLCRKEWEDRAAKLGPEFRVAEVAGEPVSLLHLPAHALYFMFCFSGKHSEDLLRSATLLHDTLFAHKMRAETQAPPKVQQHWQKGETQAPPKVQQCWRMLACLHYASPVSLHRARAKATLARGKRSMMRPSLSRKRANAGILALDAASTAT